MTVVVGGSTQLPQKRLVLSLLDQGLTVRCWWRISGSCNVLEAEIQKFAQQMMANMGQVDASGMCGAPSTDRTAAATCCLVQSHWRNHH